MRCAHPYFWVHCHAKRGAARPPPRPSQLLIRSPKLDKNYRIRAAPVMAFQKQNAVLQARTRAAMG
ncbi:MAG: hypothetical protein ACK55I_08015, partial [bacterium]